MEFKQKQGEGKRCVTAGLAEAITRDNRSIPPIAYPDASQGSEVVVKRATGLAMMNGTGLPGARQSARPRERCLA